jgi:hypothetical protein
VAPEPRNGFGVFFFVYFLEAEKGVFVGGFTNLGVQNVVFCVVNRGGVVVKTWLETTAILRLEFFIFSDFIFGDDDDQKYRGSSLRSE